MTKKSIKEIEKQCKRESEFLIKTRKEIGKIIIGQENLINRMLLSMLCSGHVLIEGIPGLAKTLSVTTLARTIHSSFHRIQFTPDLLPADLIGTLIYNPSSGKFTTHKGPIFSNIILVDEINRAPAKLQSALLEAMQEKQVTIGDKTYKLNDPFFVLATQNPIEQEGTYPLAEAQIDRFMFKLQVSYPSTDDELIILRKMSKSSPFLPIKPVIKPADILRMRKFVDRIYLSESIEKYILKIVSATRNPKKFGLDFADLIRYGASPRATIYLGLASRGHALMAKRTYVTPEDIKAIGIDVLRHRLILSYEAKAEGITSENILEKIFNTIEVQ